MSIDLETVARIRACHTPMSGGHYCIQCFGDVRVSDEDCAWPCAVVRLCDAWTDVAKQYVHVTCGLNLHDGENWTSS